MRGGFCYTTSMDYILIDNLHFSGKHGVYEKERAVEQEFLVSLRLGFDTHPSAQTDALADTLDYSEAKRIVERVITGGSCYLVERLADQIAQALLRDPRVLSAEVSIRKVAVWQNGVPGVTVVRTR